MKKDRNSWGGNSSPHQNLARELQVIGQKNVRFLIPDKQLASTYKCISITEDNFSNSQQLDFLIISFILIT